MEKNLTGASIKMKDDEWIGISKRLKADGYSVVYDYVEYLKEKIKSLQTSKPPVVKDLLEENENIYKQLRFLRERLKKYE